ncbi:MAG: hypothetical protein ABJD53_13540 [Gammaproteobacteria bacterium]
MSRPNPHCLTVDWYRTLGIQQQAASEPSDVLILYDNRQTANQVIGLAFEIARSNAEILAKQPRPKEVGGDPTSSPTLAQLQDKFTALGTTVQTEIDSDRHLLANARPEKKNQLQAKISELQGELDLISARKSLLGTLSSFANQSDPNGSGGSALKAQIEAMAVAMPTAANATGTPNPAARFGIWDFAAIAVRLSEKIAVIDIIDNRSAALQALFSQIRAPLSTKFATSWTSCRSSSSKRRPCSSRWARRAYCSTSIVAPSAIGAMPSKANTSMRSRRSACA